MNEYSYEKSTACDDVRVCELLIRRSASFHSGGFGRFLLSRPTPDCREGSFPLVARESSRSSRGGEAGSSSSARWTPLTWRQCSIGKAKPNGRVLGCLDGYRTASGKGDSSHIEAGGDLPFGNEASRTERVGGRKQAMFVGGLHVKWNYFVIFSKNWEILELDPRLFVEYSQRV